MYDDDDDDESNDSDYGSKDAESRVEEGAMDVMAEERKIVPISTKRQKIADDIFNEMNKKQNEFIKTKMSQALLFDPYHFSIEKSINKNEEKREVINKSNKNQKYSQMQSMLSSVFGNKSTEINVKKIIDSSASQASIRDEIRRAVAGLHHKQIVTESVKFAGKEIK